MKLNEIFQYHYCYLRHPDKVKTSQNLYLSDVTESEQVEILLYCSGHFIG